MSELTIYNYTTIILDMGTILMLLMLMMVTNVLRRRGRDDDKLFYYLLVVAIVMALGDIVGYITEDKSFYGAQWVQVFGMELFYLAYALEAVIWVQYTSTRFRSPDSEYNKRHLAYLYIPGLIFMSLIVVNFSTGWMFSVDADAAYHRGPLFIPMHIFIALYYLYGFITIFRYKPSGTNKKPIPLWIYVLPIGVGIIITFIIGGVSFTPAGTALSIIFTHLGSMNEITNMSYEESGV